MNFSDVFCTVSTFIFNFVFILAVIELLFCHHLKKRTHFALRMLLWIPYILLLHTMLAQWGPFAKWGQFNLVPIFTIGIFNFSYLIEFFISVGILCFCFDDNFWRILFFATASYVVHNLGHAATEFVRTSFMNGDYYLSSGIGEPPIYYVVKIAIFSFCIGCSYFLFIRRYIKNQEIQVGNAFLIVFVLSTLFIVSLFNRWTYDMRLRNASYFPMLIIIDVMLLVIQFGTFENRHVLAEKEMTEQLLYLQAKQYDSNREQAEIINRKCHDLKYQIAALRDLQSSSERDQVIQGLEKEVLLYDSKIETGNKLLNIVLTEKSRLCESLGIQFFCVADGAALDFLETSDLYALLGNAIDNAIEAEKRVKDPDKRIIEFVINQTGNIAKIDVENYYEGALEFENGLPKTVKEDKYYHGFGVKSMKYITEKYKGTMKLFTENNRFCLKIIFLKN